MNSKKIAIRRKKSNSSSAQSAEYARNYHKIGNAVEKVIKERFGDDGNQFSGSIFALVRELIGCRITEIGDCDIDAALACVEATRHLLGRFKMHCQYKDYWRERDESERQQQRASNGHSAWYNNFMHELRESIVRTRGTPALSLVPDCGRNLGPSERPSAPGPFAA